MAVPQRSDDEVRSNAAFAALMWALARPGEIQDLPEPGLECILEALVDGECRVFAADERLRQLARRRGAQVVAMDQADHVFIDGPVVCQPLRALRIGSDLYPDDGATLVLRAELEQGQDLWMSGPGIDGQRRLAIGGLPPDFWHFRRELSRYPRGFEMFLVSAARVLGIPRSTNVRAV